MFKAAALFLAAAAVAVGGWLGYRATSPPTPRLQPPSHCPADRFGGDCTNSGHRTLSGGRGAGDGKLGGGGAVDRDRGDGSFAGEACLCV